jgi:hypothetical protein
MAAVHVQHRERRAIGAVDPDHQDVGVQGAVRAATVPPDAGRSAADAEARGRRVLVRPHSRLDRGLQQWRHVIGHLGAQQQGTETGIRARVGVDAAHQDPLGCDAGLRRNALTDRLHLRGGQQAELALDQQQIRLRGEIEGAGVKGIVERGRGSSARPVPHHLRAERRLERHRAGAGDQLRQAATSHPDSIPTVTS